MSTAQNWEDLVEAQGWDENSQLMITQDFIEKNNLWEKFEEFAQQVAAEENNFD